MKPERPKYQSPLPWGSPGGQSDLKADLTEKAPAETTPSLQSDPVLGSECSELSEAENDLDVEKRKFFATISILLLLGTIAGAFASAGESRSSGEVIAEVAVNLVLSLSWLLIMAFVLFDTKRWAKQCCKWGTCMLLALTLLGLFFSFSGVVLAFGALLIWQISILEKDVELLS